MTKGISSDIVSHAPRQEALISKFYFCTIKSTLLLISGAMITPITILVTTSSFADRNLHDLKASKYSVILNPLSRTLEAEEISSLLREHNPYGIIAGVEPLTAQVLVGAPNLKIISRSGVGISNVDLDYCKEKGIDVLNTATPKRAVAELTIGLMLNLLRNIPQLNENIKQGAWKKFMGHLLSERTVGIVGLGAIGKQVAVYLHGIGSKILGNETQPDQEFCSKYDVSLVEKDKLLRESDIISLHLPDIGHYYLGEDEFARIKRGVLIVNTSRGSLIDETALIKALENGTVSGIGADVFSEEPYHGPLSNYSQAILTPHVGSYASEERDGMEKESVSNLLKAIGKRGI